MLSGMVMTVAQEGDKVMLGLQGRRFDVLLSCAQAERFAEALELAANGAEREPPSLIQGEPWECKIVSYDGMVGIRFFPPIVGAPNRVPLTASVARQLAGRVTFNMQQAKHKMAFEFHGA